MATKTSQSRKSGKSSGPPAQRAALYDKLVGLFPKVERKGKSMPYTSCNGHMFSFLDSGGNMGLRLPEEERERFLKKHGTELFVAHGTVLKEYVTVPDELLIRTSALKPWFATSLTYARSLKPKTTKHSGKK